MATCVDQATGKWGIRVNRVEFKAIEPAHVRIQGFDGEADAAADVIAAPSPPGQMPLLTAEGAEHAAILPLGEAQSNPCRGQRAQFSSLRRHPRVTRTASCSRAYMQMLPEIAKTDSNKIFRCAHRVHRSAQGGCRRLRRMEVRRRSR